MTYLAAAQLIVRRKVEDVLHELRDRVPAYPEEDGLAVLDQEKTMSF